MILFCAREYFVQTCFVRKDLRSFSDSIEALLGFSIGDTEQKKKKHRQQTRRTVKEEGEGRTQYFCCCLLICSFPENILSDWCSIKGIGKF